MDGPRDDVDRLESDPPSRTSLPVLSVALVILVALVAAVVVLQPAHSDRNGDAPTPRPTSTPDVGPHTPQPGPSSSAARVSVYVQPLDNCTITDRQGRLHVAVAVTNLSPRPFRVVTASADADPLLHRMEVRLGKRPCADEPAAGRQVRPSADVVVSLQLSVAPGCLEQEEVGIGVKVRAGHQTLHTASSTKVGLRGVGLPRC